MHSALLVVQVVIARGILYVWLLLRKQPSPWRGGHSTTLRDEFDVYGLSQGLLGFDKSKLDPVPIELQPGDAVAQSSATIHWTDTNRTPRHRRAVASFCFGASTVRDEEGHARYLASLKAQFEKRGIAATTTS